MKNFIYTILTVGFLSGCGQVPLDYFSKTTPIGRLTPGKLDVNNLSGSWQSDCVPYADPSQSFGSTFAVSNATIVAGQNTNLITVYSDNVCSQKIYKSMITSDLAVSSDLTRVQETYLRITSTPATPSVATTLNTMNAGTGFCSQTGWTSGAMSAAVNDVRMCGLPLTRSSAVSLYSDTNGDRVMIMQTTTGSITYRLVH